MEFFNKQKVLYKFQSGFRKHYLTNSGLSFFDGKHTPGGFESDVLTGMILIDLKKVIDTIDHYILL